MKEKKSLSSAVSQFSKQISRFNQSGGEDFVRRKNSDELLQEKIDISENERMEKLKRNFLLYANPVTQDIEADEEALLSAFQLYKQILEINKTYAEHRTYLLNIKIASPLCAKSEYTQKNKFSFLRLWFLRQTEHDGFVPVMEHDESRFYLSFIPKDNYTLSTFEKEILQAIS